MTEDSGACCHEAVRVASFPQASTTAPLSPCGHHPVQLALGSQAPPGWDLALKDSISEAVPAYPGPSILQAALRGTCSPRESQGSVEFPAFPTCPAKLTPDFLNRSPWSACPAL